MKSWIKIALGVLLLLPGLVFWLGPVVVEYGLLPIFGGLAIAGIVVGGVILVTDGVYDLRHPKAEKDHRT